MSKKKSEPIVLNEQKIKALPEYEKLKLEMEKPNFFTIMKMEGMEIRHSNFLAWLLDPNESHNLRELFLKWFLKELILENEQAVIERQLNEYDFFTPEMIDEINWTKVHVHREVSDSNKKNSLDILIVYEDAEPKKSFTVSIENKVFSSDHSDQLTRYKEMVARRRPECLQCLRNFKGNDLFVYLTLSGDSPTDADDNTRNSYWLFSYEKILERIEFILESYRDRMSDKVILYLSDYRDNLVRNVLDNDPKLEQLAKDLLEKSNAKNLINGADRSNNPVIDRALQYRDDLNEPFKSIIKGKGYQLAASCDRKYVRFLPKLDDKENETLKRLTDDNKKYYNNYLETLRSVYGENIKDNHWPNYELFLFELVIERSKGMSVGWKASIGPSIYHDDILSNLYRAIHGEEDSKKSESSEKSRGRFWHIQTIFSIKGETEEKIKDALERKITANQEKIKAIETAFREWLQTKNPLDLEEVTLQ